MERRGSMVSSLLFWALVGSALCSGLGHSVSGKGFDYFMLSIYLPGTVCSHTNTSECCSDNACCRSEAPLTFTIHGLWADYADGSWPSCCGNAKFDGNKIAVLEPSLEKFWPSLKCGSSSTCNNGHGSFWASQWEKHGTCSYPVIKDQFEYFATALRLYNEYNVTKLLADAGIKIRNGKKYPRGDIKDAIKYPLKATPQLVCEKSLLRQIRICFDKAFKPRDCVIPPSAKECPRNIYLPTYKPPKKANIDGENIMETVASLFVA